MSRFKTGVLKTREPLRIGFLPTTDCSPLVFAKEAGLFEQYGLMVELVRGASGATLGERIVNGDLDLAQTPAPVPFLANLGVDEDPSSCISPIILSLQGSGVTVSTKLWSQDVSGARGLQEYIRRNWGRRTVVVGVPSPFSTQAFLLEHWLRAGGIDSRTQVRIVTVPPEQMYATLKLGYVDVFCAPEPWNSVAVHAGQGICVATSPDLAPLHPETVLITRQSFAAGRSEELERVVAALLDACSICEQPDTRGFLTNLLAHPQYVNAPSECLSASMVGPFISGHNEVLKPPLQFFHRYIANQPSEERATWVIEHLYEALGLHASKRTVQEKTPILRNVFRRDIFERAEDLATRGAAESGGHTNAKLPSISTE